MAEVSELLRTLGAELVMPRFNGLEEADVREKAPGDPVTIVDHQVEARLLDALPKLIPASRVIGEEGAAARPEILSGLGEGWVWTVDPLDGTANFVEGRPGFTLMVGLLRNGEPVAGWIYSPTAERLWSVEAGSGAHVDGRPISGHRAYRDALRGKASFRHVPRDVRSKLTASETKLAPYEGSAIAGVEYPAVAEGGLDFLFYWRTYPWDHVPGSLLVREAGGVADRLDGSPYRPGDGRSGLLIAGSRESWDRARDLFPISLGKAT